MNRSRLLLSGDHSAGHPGPRVARGVRAQVVRLGVNHQSRAIGIEQRGLSGAQGEPGKHVLQSAAARPDLDVAQIPSMRPLWIQAAVLPVGGVEVVTRRAEIGRFAAPGLVGCECRGSRPQVRSLRPP